MVLTFTKKQKNKYMKSEKINIDVRGTNLSIDEGEDEWEKEES